MTIANDHDRKLMPATRMTLICLATGAMLAICACGRSPTLPDGFEEVASSTIAGQKVVIARDTGTGCEIVLAGTGVMPRNERSGDGASVKQRCVSTGGESASTTPAGAAVVDTTVPAQQTAEGSSAAESTPASAATPATSASPAPGGTNPAQDEAVARAVQETASQAPPPAAIPAGRVPPPSGRRSSRPIHVARPPLTTPVVGSNVDEEGQQ